MKLVKFISAFMLFAISMSSSAKENDWHLQIHGVSYHSAKRIVGTWNERNDGIGFRYEHSNNTSTQFGVYKNSNSTQDKTFTTVYGIVEYDPVIRGKYQFGVFGGIASGYDEYKYTCEYKVVKVQGANRSYSKTADGYLVQTVSSELLSDKEKRVCVDDKRSIEVVNKRIVPIVGLVARFQDDNLNTTVRFIPKVAGHSPAVFTIEVGFKF